MSGPGGCAKTRSGPLFLGVTAGEDARHEVEYVRGADLAVAVVLHQPVLHQVDLLLRLLVHHRGHQVLELDAVLLILEELELERLVQPLVGPVVERLAVHGERADVVHDLPAEVVLAGVRDVDLLFNRPHQALVRLLVEAGVLVLDLLLLGVGLDVVDVVAAQLADGVLVGADGALDLVLDDVLVLLLHAGEHLAEALARVVAVDERVALEARLQLVEHHEGVDAALALVAHQGVGDFILDVAGADALEAFPAGLLAELLDVVLGEVGQRLAVVELELLQERQVVLLGLLQAREHGPHGGHLQGVRRDVLALDGAGVEVLLVDLHLLGQLGDVRDVDLHRTVTQGLHELVGLELLELGLVGVPDDDLVDVRLGELLGLDLVLLRGAQEIVEEGDVELEHFHELDEAAVGDVELAIEVEGARVRVRAVLGDLPVVDVAGELGGVLVLLVLGLEGANAHAVLLAEDEPVDRDVLDDLGEVTLVLRHQVLEDVAARGAQLAARGDGVAALRGGQLRERLGAPLAGDEVERLLVHRALHLLAHGAVAIGALLVDGPAERVGGALGRLGVLLQALLEQARDGGLGGAHGAVQEDDALFRAVALGRGLEDVDELHERHVQAEDGVPAAELLVGEEVVADELLLVVDVLALPVGEDHVVDPLEGGAGHLGILPDDVEVVLEGALPVEFRVDLRVLERGDPRDPRTLVFQVLHDSPSGSLDARNSALSGGPQNEPGGVLGHSNSHP